MLKDVARWYTPRLERDVTLARWGHYGTAVLLFPTAGGDAEEVERMGLIGALTPLIDDGRIKVYSTDSVAGQAWISHQHPLHCSYLQNRFDEYIYSEVLPAIRTDCNSHDTEVITAGASIGAFNAVATVCRHPDAFRLAIGMSGTYDLSKFLGGEHMSQDFYFSSPLHYLPQLEGPARPAEIADDHTRQRRRRLRGHRRVVANGTRAGQQGHTQSRRLLGP